MSKVNKLVAIRIRGIIGLKYNVRKTLENIGLKKKFSARLFDDTEENRKLLRGVKDYVAFGEADEDTLKKFKENVIISLQPPLGGFKKSTLSTYPKGELGYRKESINEIFRRMAR